MHVVRVVVMALYCVAAAVSSVRGGAVVAANPADEIPVFATPTTGPSTKPATNPNKPSFNPIKPAVRSPQRAPLAPVVTRASSSPPKSTTDRVPRPQLSFSPKPTHVAPLLQVIRASQPPPLESIATATYVGMECGADFPFGSDAVSVEGRGTFCAFTPVCAGAVVGKCPGKQPGLGVAAQCEPVKGNVFGCVVGSE